MKQDLTIRAALKALEYDIYSIWNHKFADLYLQIIN